MAKREIPINKLEKYCALNAPKIINKELQVGDEVITYEVRTRLSLKECIKFVHEVVSEYIRPNDEMIIPMAREFLIYRNILTYYANFRMPEDINKVYELVMGSIDIIETIVDCVDDAQYKMLVKAIDDSIEFEKKKMVAAQEVKTAQLVSEVSAFVTRMSTLFEDIDGEQMSAFISNLSGIQDITAKDLAGAVVGQSQESNN